MKKYLILLLIIAFTVSMLFIGMGCKEEAPPTEEVVEEEEAPPTEETEAPKVEKLVISYSAPFMSHEIYQNMVAAARRGYEEIEEKTGIVIDFSVADANNEIDKQVADVETFIAKKSDVIWISVIDPEVVKQLVKNCHDAGIPVMTGSAMAGNEDAYFTLDDYLWGKQVGLRVGKYVKENWNPKGIIAKSLIVGFPSLPTCIDRVDGFTDGMNETGCQWEKTVEVDGKAVMSEALPICTDALTANPDVNLIYGINNDSAFGGWEAYKSLGRDEEKLLVCAVGFEGERAIKALLEGGPYKCDGTAFFNYMGRICAYSTVALGLGLIGPDENDEPYMVYGPVSAIDINNFYDFYTEEDGKWVENWDVIDKLAVEQGLSKEILELKY